MSYQGWLLSQDYTPAFLPPAGNTAICRCTRAFFWLSVAIFRLKFSVLYQRLCLVNGLPVSSLYLLFPKRVRVTSFMHFPRNCMYIINLMVTRFYTSEGFLRICDCSTTANPDTEHGPEGLWDPWVYSIK